MIRTRVGYAGGTKDKPTYHALGNHTEAVQVEFDPRVVSYDRLLEVFWASHDPFSPVWSTQYKAVLWTHGPEQAAAARRSFEAVAEAGERTPTTEVREAGRFWIAEDYHQKYGLRRRPALLEALLGADASGETVRQSTLAARANGWLAGYGTPEEIAAELDRLEVPEAAREALAAALGDRAPPPCR